ncbi:MAG TPA: SMP-30/gluconolactonase/LRE family protein [Bryobacteraceae bacterium]|nr:SMP-30/gluconolactonase/LRE family protein [Bryobacteraceae bacterium]
MRGALRLRYFALASATIALLSAQDFSGLKLELTAKDFQYTQGPAWSAVGSFLIFSDIPTDRLMKWVPGHEPEVFRTDAHGPSGNAFDSHDRLYTCETRTRRVTRTVKNGQVETVAATWEGKKLNAPSGIVIGKSDHVYFTDPAFGSQQDHRELSFYGVYHIPPKGPMKLAAKWTTRPNGIALSPNGRTLYVSAPDDHAIRAYDLDKEGDASNERVFADKLDGVPAGMHVDEKGNLYVAANGILVFHPDGKLAATIPVRERPSNCAFGFPDATMLFVTAHGNLYRAKVDVKGIF